MRQITWNELSRTPADLLEWIQRGHPLRIYQEGKPIAELIPFQPHDQPAWKRPIKRLVLPIENISREILQDRDEQRV